MNNPTPRRFRLRNGIIVEEAEEHPVCGPANRIGEEYSDTYKVIQSISGQAQAWTVGSIHVLLPFNGVRGRAFDMVEELAPNDPL